MPTKKKRVNQAASMLGKLSAKKRRQTLGEKAFLKSMRALGKKGGSAKKRRKGGK